MSNCLNKEKKETELITVRQLLGNSDDFGENCFRVPDYQRGYAWDTQFVDLWNDILRIYRNSGKTKHYTGMLSLEEMPEESKKTESLIGKNAFFIVDGQQRITSLIIIIKSIIDYIERDAEPIEAYHNLLFLDFDIPRFDYSRERKDSSQQYFKERIYENSPNINCSDNYLKNINNAKQFVDSYLIKYDIEQAKGILETILDRLFFNIYFVTKEFDVRVTFETMNNRGKKLSNLELLKNRLMYLSSFLSSSAIENSNYEINLKNIINDTWKKIYENLCYRDYQLKDDEYLQSHWIVYGSLEKKKKDAYIKEILQRKFDVDNGLFSEYIKNKEYKKAYEYIYNYVTSLGYYSRYWGIINNPKERSGLISNQDETEMLDKLIRIAPIQYVKSTIMAVEGASSKFLSSQQKIDFFIKLENSLFINRLIGRSENDYSMMIKNARDIVLAKNQKEALDGYNNLIALFNSSNELEDNKLKITNESLKHSFEKFGIYINDSNKGYYGWDGIIYLLYEYDRSIGLNTDKEIIWSEVSSNSIEHILPQTPTAPYWKIILRDIVDNNDEINKVTNSLGNLLLLSRGENSSLQNFSFPIKKSTTVSTSKFAYNQGTRSAREVTEKDHWTLYNIRQRAKKIFKFAYDNWVSKYCDLNYDDFVKLLDDNNLLIKEYKQIDDKTKEELSNSIDPNERNITIYKPRGQNEEWFNELSRFFDTNLYGINKTSSNASRIENRFTFVKKDNLIVCAIKIDGVDHKFEYYEDEKTLYVRYYKDKWIYTNDIASLAVPAIYFVKTFTRYLKMRSNPVREDDFKIYSPDDVSDDALTEEEFFKIRSYKESSIELYKLLRNRLDNFEGSSVFWRPNYCAYKCKYNFIEIHLKTDGLQLNVKLDKDIDSLILKKIPESYNWKWNNQLFINDKSQIDEAIRIIKESYLISK